MDWRAAFKGDFIKAVEFQGKEPTLTIVAVKVVEVEDEKTKTKKGKLVVFFKETDRGWIPCKTAGFCLAALFGSNETNTWTGKRVTLFCDPTVKFGSETVEGIRVRGSPEIAKTITVTIKLPKKKPKELKLIPTQQKNGKAATAPPAASDPEPEPETPPEPGEEPPAAEEPRSAGQEEHIPF